MRSGLAPPILTAALRFRAGRELQVRVIYRLQIRTFRPYGPIRYRGIGGVL